LSFGGDEVYSFASLTVRGSVPIPEGLEFDSLGENFGLLFLFVAYKTFPTNKKKIPKFSPRGSNSRPSGMGTDPLTVKLAKEYTSSPPKLKPCHDGVRPYVNITLRYAMMA
jgi:hypothetical protein